MKQLVTYIGGVIAACLLAFAPAAYAEEESRPICVAKGGAEVRAPWPEGNCPPVYPEGAYMPESGKLEQTITPNQAKILAHMRFVESGFAGKPTIEIEGINVHILSGYQPNSCGTGNVLIGNAQGIAKACPQDNLALTENEAPWNTNIGGTMNLIVGHNTAEATGAFVAGDENIANGPFSSILGGKGKSTSSAYQDVP